MTLASRMKRLLGRTRWSIGIYEGASPLTLAPVEGVENPVVARQSVTDGYAFFVADPFMLRVDGTWHMFFEVLRWKNGRTIGEIALSTSRDGLRWDYQRTVLSEPFHLSYPYVFEWASDHYMIPESHEAGGVRLYQADPFPTRWVFVTDLLKGPVLLDSSVFRYDDTWWMFTETNPDLKQDTLRLFGARDLTGPWREHPRSPIVQGNARIARPAGRVLCSPDRVIRFCQETYPTYGTNVRAFEITRLTANDYEERETEGNPVLRPEARGWNRRGMHHVDAHRLDDGRWIACVDGWYRGVMEPGEIVERVSDRLSR